MAGSFYFGCEDYSSIVHRCCGASHLQRRSFSRHTRGRTAVVHSVGSVAAVCSLLTAAGVKSPRAAVWTHISSYTAFIHVSHLSVRNRSQWAETAFFTRSCSHGFSDLLLCSWQFCLSCRSCWICWLCSQLCVCSLLNSSFHCSASNSACCRRTRPESTASRSCSASSLQSASHKRQIINSPTDSDAHSANTQDCNMIHVN